MLEGEELRHLAEGGTLFLGVAPNVHHCRLHLVQEKGARVVDEICIVELYLLCQSVKHLVFMDVVVQQFRVWPVMPHGAPLL